MHQLKSVEGGEIQFMWEYIRHICASSLVPADEVAGDLPFCTAGMTRNQSVLNSSEIFYQARFFLQVKLLSELITTLLTSTRVKSAPHAPQYASGVEFKHLFYR